MALARAGTPRFAVVRAMKSVFEEGREGERESPGNNNRCAIKLARDGNKRIDGLTRRGENKKCISFPREDGGAAATFAKIYRDSRLFLRKSTARSCLTDSDFYSAKDRYNVKGKALRPMPGKMICMRDVGTEYRTNFICGKIMAPSSRGATQ